jgi:hypothetical protein
LVDRHDPVDIHQRSHHAALPSVAEVDDLAVDVRLDPVEQPNSTPTRITPWTAAATRRHLKTPASTDGDAHPVVGERTAQQAC